MKKKVMYLLEYPLDLPGGAQMSTHSLCTGLMDSDFLPQVVCPHLLKHRVEEYEFPVFTYPMGEKRIKNLFMRVLAFWKIIKKQKPDIIHIQMPESLITYGILRGFGFFRRIRLVFTDRGLFYGYRKHSMVLMKHALKHCDKMLCTTAFNQKLWEEGTSIRPIEVVANTISDRFRTYEEEKRKSTEDFVLGFAGRICEEKNWPLVNVICRRLKEEGVSFKVAIVMSVFEENDMNVVKEVVGTLEHDLGKENVMSFLDFTQEQMADFYYMEDVFVMTSRFESFGKAAVEAMSRKCAVVSTDVGGLREVIGKEENLYQENNLEPCIAYIKRLYVDKDKRKEDQEFFFHRYQTEYSQSKCLNDHLKIYADLQNAGR